MAKASAPSRVPTPICRIEVVNAAISPSLRAKSRRETPSGWAELSWGQRLAGHTVTPIFWDVSRDFLRFRQRANPLVIVEMLRGRVFSFLKNIC